MRRSPLLCITLLGHLACGDSPVEVREWGAMQFRASATVRGDSVAHVLLAHNTSDSTATLSTSCENAGGVLIVRHVAVAGIAWSERAWLRQQGCFPLINHMNIAPGDEVELRRVLSLESILGDSLPQATYRLSVGLSFLGGVPFTEIPLSPRRLSR